MKTGASDGIMTVSVDRQGAFYVAGTRLFILHWNDKAYVVPDSCPHRGGPLSLGECNKEKGKIICPWHKGQIPVQKLLKEALPAVRVGRTISFF